MKRLDLTDQTFGRLTVVREGERHRYPGGGTARTWLCRCECGNETTVIGKNLTGGSHTRSCGCLHRERASSAKREGRPVTYLGAHTRLAVTRGPAKLHTCVDCGCPASEWAFARERASSILTGPTSRGLIAPYSENVDDYDARCKSCHAKYDRVLEVAA